MPLMAVVANLTLGAGNPQLTGRGLALERDLDVLPAGNVVVCRVEERTRAAAVRERIERGIASL